MTDQGLEELLDLNPPGMTADEAAGRANAYASVIIPSTERVDDPSLFREPEVGISVESLSGLGSWLLSVATSLLVVEAGWVELSVVSNTYLTATDDYSGSARLAFNFSNELAVFPADEGSHNFVG